MGYALFFAGDCRSIYGYGSNRMKYYDLEPRAIIRKLGEIILQSYNGTGSKKKQYVNRRMCCLTCVGGFFSPIKRSRWWLGGEKTTKTRLLFRWYGWSCFLSFSNHLTTEANLGFWRVGCESGYFNLSILQLRNV